MSVISPNNPTVQKLKLKNDLKILNDIRGQKNSLYEQCECGIISLADITNELAMQNKKELKIKEKW